MEEVMIKKRPGIITAICIIGFLGILLSIPIIFYDIAKTIGSWYPPYLAFSAIVVLVCIVGMWKMKKWSIILYATFVGINQIVLMAIGVWNVMAILLPAIIIAIGFSKFKAME